MMELRIRKSALRMAKILYYGGFVLIWIALPVTLLAVSHAGPGALITEAWLAKRFFAVFVPSVLSGQNIYLWSIITCIYTIVMTMLLINGADKKSFAAGMGCFLGVAIAGILTLIMDKILMLTGKRETSNPDFFRAGKLYIKPLTSAEADSNFVRVSRGLFIVLELSI